MKNTVKIPWLDELKAGDQVVFINLRGVKTIETVTGVSKKSVFINEIQFSKFSGKPVQVRSNYKYYHDYKIEQITDVFKQQVELERLKMAELLMTYDFSKLKYKELEKICLTLRIIEKNSLQKRLKMI